jgi:DNA polymerase-4
LSINKTVSKIGTGEGKPKGHLDIPENQVRAFLNRFRFKKFLWWAM